MKGKIATWNYISLQIICNWKQHPAPVWALLLTSSTANSSKIHWASCNAGAVSVMLRANELIIPSGRVNSSVVESLKTQTQTVNWTCCFKRSAAFCAPAPLCFVFLLLFAFLVWEWSPIQHLHSNSLECKRNQGRAAANICSWKFINRLLAFLCAVSSTVCLFKMKCGPCGTFRDTYY